MKNRLTSEQFSDVSPVDTQGNLSLKTEIGEILRVSDFSEEITPFLRYLSLLWLPGGAYEQQLLLISQCEEIIRNIHERCPTVDSLEEDELVFLSEKAKLNSLLKVIKTYLPSELERVISQPTDRDMLYSGLTVLEIIKKERMDVIQLHVGVSILLIRSLLKDEKLFSFDLKKNYGVRNVRNLVTQLYSYYLPGKNTKEEYVIGDRIYVVNKIREIYLLILHFLEQGINDNTFTIDYPYTRTYKDHFFSLLSIKLKNAGVYLPDGIFGTWQQSLVKDYTFDKSFYTIGLLWISTYFECEEYKNDIEYLFSHKKFRSKLLSRSKWSENIGGKSMNDDNKLVSTDEISKGFGVFMRRCSLLENKNNTFFPALYLFCMLDLPISLLGEMDQSGKFSYSTEEFVKNVHKHLGFSIIPIDFVFKKLRRNISSLTLLQQLDSFLSSLPYSPEKVVLYSEPLFEMLATKSFHFSTLLEMRPYLSRCIDTSMSFSVEGWYQYQINTLQNSIPHYEKYLLPSEREKDRKNDEVTSIKEGEEKLKAWKIIELRKNKLGDEGREKDIIEKREKIFVDPVDAYIFFSERIDQILLLVEMIGIDALVPEVSTNFEHIHSYLQTIDLEEIDSPIIVKGRFSLRKYMEILDHKQTEKNSLLSLRAKTNLLLKDESRADLLQEVHALSPIIYKEIMSLLKVFSSLESKIRSDLYQNMLIYLYLFVQENVLGNHKDFRYESTIHKFLFLLYASKENNAFSFIEKMIESIVNDSHGLGAFFEEFSLDQLMVIVNNIEYGVDKNIHYLLTPDETVEKDNSNDFLEELGIYSNSTLTTRKLVNVLQILGYTVARGKGDHMKAYVEINGEKVGRTLIIDRNSQTISYRGRKFLSIAIKNKKLVGF